MAELSDVELLAHLRSALAPPLMRPDEKTLAQLHATLAEMAREAESVGVNPAVHYRTAGGRSALPRRRRRTARSSVLAAGAMAFALTAGVAAAAVATNTLPGPTRAIAFDLGLPVTSPALFRAQQSVTQLRRAILAKNVAREHRLGRRLIRELRTLQFSDLSHVRGAAEKLLVEVGLALPTLADPKTPVTTTDTTPSTSVPPVIGRGTSVPSVPLPIVSTPIVTVPRVSVPSISVPRVSVPSETNPSVTPPTPVLPLVRPTGLPRLWFAEPSS